MSKGRYKNMKTVNKKMYDEAMFNMNNEMVFNKDVSDMDICVYACMKSFVGFNMCASSSITTIYNMLSFNNRHLQKDIKESLVHLAELDYGGYYDWHMNEIDIVNVKPNDTFIVYFGEDGIWNENNKQWQEYFPIKQNYFNTLLTKCNETKAKCKFIRFGFIVLRTLNYNSCMIPWITFSGIKNVVGNQNTMNTYLNLLSDIIYYNNSFVNATGKNCSTYIINKDYMSYEEFYKSVKDECNANGYFEVDKEEDSKRKKDGIKKSNML